MPATVTKLNQACQTFSSQWRNSWFIHACQQVVALAFDCHAPKSYKLTRMCPAMFHSTEVSLVKNKKERKKKKKQAERKGGSLQSLAMVVHLKFNGRISDEPTLFACLCAIVRESRRIAAIIHEE